MKNEFVNHSKHAHISAQSIDATVAFLEERRQTVDFGDQNISNKYFDKLLFDYPLKQFRKDGYSKEVKVLQTDLPDLKRALQAVILSQYRRKIFEKSRLVIKPVILFKSRTIQESKDFFERFADLIKNLTAEQIREIRRDTNDTALKKAFTYFEASKITLENLAQELKGDFAEEKCISVNSKEEGEERQIAVNTLEDETNEYRAVFAVDKLNEGWDVLNLFDIVRLYNTRDAKGGKPGKTTMSEAQLIGRGARYCPFQVVPEQSRFTRKFDDDLENEMRIGEELYYHSPHNPQYIQELNTALQEIGIKPKESKQVFLNLKEEFKKSEFYEKGIIFINERQKYDRSDITGFESTLITKKHKVSLATGYSRAFNVFTETIAITAPEKIQKDFRLLDFGERIILKALHCLNFYGFNNLKAWLPNLKSLSEFIASENYLGKITVEVEGMKSQVENLSPSEKLDITIRVLEDIAGVLESDKVEYKGTKEFASTEYIILDN
jgi:type III restriction enzyme